MPLGTNNRNDTGLDVAIPEIWSSRINEAIRRTVKLPNFFTDRSDELVGGGDVFYTLNGETYSSATKTNGSEVTLQNPTTTRASVTVDTWIESSLLFEDREYKQMKQSPALIDSFATGLGHAIAKSLDDAIANLFSGFSTSVGASTSNLTQSVIMEAVANAATNSEMDVTEETGWAFIFHTNTYWQQLGNIDNFVRLDATGNNSLSNGVSARLLGIPVIVTTAVPNVSGTSGRYNVLVHRDAIHWARLSYDVMTEDGAVGEFGVRFQKSYVHEYLGTLMTADICYGVGENRDLYGVRILTHATKA